VTKEQRTVEEFNSFVLEFDRETDWIFDDVSEKQIYTILVLQRSHMAGVFAELCERLNIDL